MILSASRRTDIPCYYGEWLLHRLNAGTVLLQNPMNRSQISRLHFSPDTVDCIVFWTKDPLNLLDKLNEIERLGYRCYFQFTLTPYENEIERNVRDKAGIANTLVSLSKILGRSHIHWRYDPIILNDRLTIPWHRERFSRMCEQLAGYVDGVTISFVTMYAKLKTDLLRPIGEEEMQELGAVFGEIACQYGLPITTCCARIDLSGCGIQTGSCIDKSALEKVCGYPLELTRDKNQRVGCGCYESVDVGAYDTCANGCCYCYAVQNQAIAARNHALHDPNAEMLCGVVPENAIIKEKAAISNRRMQERLF